MGEDKKFPPPIQVGGSLGEIPILEGGRHPTNSPELFPRIEIGSYKFLSEIASAAMSLEEKLSLGLTPSQDTRLFTPPSIRRIVDVAERLVLCKPEDEQELKSKPGSEKLEPRDYFLYRLEKAETSIKEEDKVRSCIDRLQMRFLPPPRSSPNNPEVLVVFSPRTRRRMYGDNGRPISCLDDLTKEETKRLLSLRGLPAEEVLRIMETQKEFYPTLEIKSGGADFKVEFHDGFAFCEMAISSGKYGKEFEEDEKEMGHDEDDDNNKADKIGTSIKSAKMKMPLSRLRTTGEIFDFSSQDKVDKWLNDIALDMAAKARLNS